MTTNEVRSTIDTALAALASDLEAGRSDAMDCYLRTMARFHRYSPGNQLLIFVQRPDATHVAGFQVWKSLGRYVKRGEHGIRILAPCFARKKKDKTSDEADKTDDPLDSPDRAPGSFRVASVFDVSQTEGDPLDEPSRVEGDPGLALRQLEDFVRGDLGASLAYVDGLCGAQGASYGGRIELLKGLTPAHTFSVLVHEAAHEALHWSVPEEIRTDKTLVETQAEAVAFVVCHAIGLETNGAAADYIGLYKGDRETLRRSLTAIHAAAGRILAAVTPRE